MAQMWSVTHVFVLFFGIVLVWFFSFLLTLSLLITCYPDGEDRGFRGQLAGLQKVQKEFFFNHLSWKLQ